MPPRSAAPFSSLTHCHSQKPAFAIREHKEKIKRQIIIKRYGDAHSLTHSRSHSRLTSDRQTGRQSDRSRVCRTATAARRLVVRASTRRFCQSLRVTMVANSRNSSAFIASSSRVSNAVCFCVCARVFSSFGRGEYGRGGAGGG